MLPDGFLAESAAFNSFSRQHEPKCLHKTRVDLLAKLRRWIDSPNSKCIFGLKGMAGTGKSTIAHTIASEFEKLGKLGASFFFSRGKGELENAAKFFPTIASQLAKTSSHLNRSIGEAIAADRDIPKQSLDIQWQKLILFPLKKLEGWQTRTLVIVIDALDECRDYKTIGVILRLLAEAKDLNTVRLRILLTSRPEFLIDVGFNKIPLDAREDLVLHDIDQSVVDHDISIFIEHELAGIQHDFHLPKDWPGDERIKHLVKDAGGLFIYAATICRFIGDDLRDPAERLEKIEEGRKSRQSPLHLQKGGDLPKLYKQILDYSVFGVNCSEDAKDELAQRFQQYVGPIILIFDLLSVDSLSKLLSVDSRDKGDMKAALRKLGSVLDAPEKEDSPIRLLHPSFRDFLLNKQACQDDYFWINEKKVQEGLVKNCLQVMLKDLKKDICGLQKPGTLVSEVKSSSIARDLPSHVQYACRYWVDHLQLLDNHQREKSGLCDDGIVHVFLQQHFLHWLEALSLMKEISKGVKMVSMLKSMLEVSHSNLSYTVREVDIAVYSLIITLICSLWSRMHNGLFFTTVQSSKRPHSKCTHLLLYLALR